MYTLSITLFLVAWILVGVYGYWLMVKRTKSWVIPSPFIFGGLFSFLASQIVEEVYFDGRADMHNEVLGAIHRWINKGGTLKVREEGGVSVEEEGK